MLAMVMFRNKSKLMLAIWALLFLAGIVAIVFARWSLGFVILSTMVLSLLPPLLASRFSLSLPLPFLLATTLFLIASILLGEAFGFYQRLWWWDLALHGSSAVGFGLMGFLFVFMLFQGDRFNAPATAIAFITFCVAMTIGAVWEVFEFLMDQSLGLNMQKSGLDDTMEDLIVNAAGSLFASISGYLYLTRHSSGVVGRALAQFVNLNKRFYKRARDRSRK